MLKESTTGAKIAKSLVFSIGAQLVSLLTNFILGFIVPKFIPELQYSYWQTYLMYVVYYYLLNLGLLGGMVVRYAQYDYDELDKTRIRSIFAVLTALQAAICVGSFCFAAFVPGLSNVTRTIICVTACGIFAKNVFTYTSYTFQMTNRITKYATLVIVQRAIYIAVVVLMLLLDVDDFYWFCIADIAGDIISVLIWQFWNRGMYIGRLLPFKEMMREAGKTLSFGLAIVVADFCGGFIIGGAKMVTQMRWGSLVFGKVSFSFSLINVFLSFVTAISVVLFPSLKRMKQEELPDLYGTIRNGLSPIMFVAMVAYYPMCWILELWLPQYESSLVYLGVLLPTMIFTSKVSLLTNNYLKAYFKERLMLIINASSLALGMALAFIAAYVFDSLDMLFYCVLAVVVIRSVVSEIVVGRIIHRDRVLDYIVEITMTVLFVVFARYLPRIWGLLAYSAALIVYLIIYRKNLAFFLNKIKAKLSRKKAV